MTVIAVANQKGGSGKTSTTVTLAATLAERGHRVLLIDLDPQASATAWLGGDVDADPGALRRALVADDGGLEPLIRAAAAVPGVSLIGSSRQLGCVFRPKAASDSDGRRPLIPTQGGHRFQFEGGRSCGCAGMAGRLGSDGWPPWIGIVVPA